MTQPWPWIRGANKKKKMTNSLFGLIARDSVTPPDALKLTVRRAGECHHFGILQHFDVRCGFDPINEISRHAFG